VLTVSERDAAGGFSTPFEGIFTVVVVDADAVTEPIRAMAVAATNTGTTRLARSIRVTSCSSLCC
jgi:hypothetical protein